MQTKFRPKFLHFIFLHSLFYKSELCVYVCVDVHAHLHFSHASPYFSLETCKFLPDLADFHKCARKSCCAAVSGNPNLIDIYFAHNLAFQQHLFVKWGREKCNLMPARCIFTSRTCCPIII